MFFQEWSPQRMTKEVSSVSLLWNKQLGHGVDSELAQVLAQYDGNIILHANDSLLSFDITTGQTLWSIEVPSSIVVQFYDDKLFVTSGKRAAIAPTTIDRYEYYCNTHSSATIAAYDAQTGQQLWQYSYNGVSPSNLEISEQRAYLFGSGNHGASRALAQVDARTGDLLTYTCAPRYEDELPPVPANEAITGEYLADMIRKKNDAVSFYEGQCIPSCEIQWSSVVDDNRLFIVDRNRQIVGHVTFEGFRLNPHNVGIAVFDDILIVYLSDSHQLFGFRLDYL